MLHFNTCNFIFLLSESFDNDCLKVSTNEETCRIAETKSCEIITCSRDVQWELVAATKTQYVHTPKR